MSIVQPIVQRWRSWRLGRAIRSGKAPHGRVSLEPTTELNVDMPTRATMRMRVIRADGTVEDMGVVAETYASIPEATWNEALRSAQEGD